MSSPVQLEIGIGGGPRSGPSSQVRERARHERNKNGRGYFRKTNELGNRADPSQTACERESKVLPSVYRPLHGGAGLALDVLKILNLVLRRGKSSGGGPSLIRLRSGVTWGT